jgi:hypothetical protein
MVTAEDCGRSARHRYGRTDTGWVPERMHAGTFTVESTGLPAGNDPSTTAPAADLSPQSRRNRMRKSVYVAATAAVVAAAGATLWGVSGANASTTDDSASSLVEDYNYPGADAVAAQVPGLQLFKGDGHIVFKGVCTDSTGMLAVESSITGSVSKRLCFQVLSTTSGFLTLKVPDTSFVDGDGTHKVEATVNTDDGRTLDANVGLTGFTPVGSATGDDNIGALVELRVGWDPSLPTP